MEKKDGKVEIVSIGARSVPEDSLVVTAAEDFAKTGSYVVVTEIPMPSVKGESSVKTNPFDSSTKQ